MEQKRDLKLGRAIMLLAAGVLMNVAGTYIAQLTGVPLFFDTIGTIVTAFLGGYLPGVVVALVTNIFRELFEHNSVYYGVLNALMAIAAAFFIRSGRLKKVRGVIAFIAILSLIGGGLGGILGWYLEGPFTEGRYIPIMDYFYGIFHTGPFLTQILASIFVDLLDKIVTVLLVILVMTITSRSSGGGFGLEAWMQAPLSKEQRESMHNLANRKWSLRSKLVLVLVITSLMLMVTAVVISLLLFREYTIDQHTKMASGIAELEEDVLDPERIDEYIEFGEAAEGYTEIKEKLYKIRDTSPDIQYVYIYQIREDGCYVVFDLDTEDVEGGAAGDVIPFDESFMSLVPDLLAGNEIEPMITDDSFGWLLTVYHPVYNAAGRCVCYTCADVSMNDLWFYSQTFLVKLSTLFLGVFILVLTGSLFLAEYHMILPINSMASCAKEFAYSENSGEGNLEKIENLQIHTGDEVENLYDAFTKMTKDSVSYVEDIKKHNAIIEDMQSGLIMVIADMVENRDESTGDHIKKTAAYTRIIMDGLLKKKYYEDQLTPKFIADVEQSAPLHDVGKIKVPDHILNKPGKLTDEEFEIMKTHTTAGKEIMEQAIEKVHGESYLTEARNLAAYHHEKWNGKGYPEGLKGEEIPLSARIMAVADVFDALVSKRVYKPAMPFDKAMGIILDGAGEHFDPKVAEVFAEATDEVKAVAEYFDRRNPQPS